MGYPFCPDAAAFEVFGEVEFGGDVGVLGMQMLRIPGKDQMMQVVMVECLKPDRQILIEVPQ